MSRRNCLSANRNEPSQRAKMNRSLVSEVGKENGASRANNKRTANRVAMPSNIRQRLADFPACLLYLRRPKSRLVSIRYNKDSPKGAISRRSRHCFIDVRVCADRAKAQRVSAHHQASVVDESVAVQGGKASSIAKRVDREQLRAARQRFETSRFENGTSSER